MLKSISPKNYKNLTGQFDFKNLNILIGSNGSGKSNLVSYLRFLKDCLTPVADEDRGITNFDDAVSKLGSDRILDHYISSPARINFTYCFTNLSDDEQRNIVFEFQLFVDRKLFTINIVSEKLYLDFGQEKQFYCYKFHDQETGKGVVSIYDNAEEKHRFFVLNKVPSKDLGLRFIEQIISMQPINKIEEIPDINALPSEDDNVYKIKQQLLVRDWKFYNTNNMNLDKIRTSEPKIGQGDIYLSSSGDNLPLVLENLITKDIDFEDKINEAMKAILPKTRKVRPIRSGRLSLTIEWYFEDTKEPLYLSDMSDGTVRMLCLAIILNSPNLPSLLVIDEPKLGLHIAWLKILAEWIKRASEKTQIIISTHSPDLLDHFTDHLENVICFDSDDNKHFSAKYLNPKLLESKLKEGWELGDLYRVGDPSIGGWPW